jgi:hypothetical protein
MQTTAPGGISAQNPAMMKVAIAAIFPLIHAEINCFDLLSIAAFRSRRKILGYPQIQYG